MNTYWAVFLGCHGRTVLELTLTAEQAKQLRALAALLRRAGRTSRRPTLRIYEEAGL